MIEKPLCRAVFDTNLLVRLLISPYGVTSQLVPALEARAFRLILSEPLLLEFLTVVRLPRMEKFGPYSDSDLWKILRYLRHEALVVPGHYQGLDKVPSDLKDNIVVACALEGEADYIVTDDRRDLLPLKVIRCSGYRPVQIVSPPAFLRLLGY